eukprot:4239178-Prymnesium_polylepis.2
MSSRGERSSRARVLAAASHRPTMDPIHHRNGTIRAQLRRPPRPLRPDAPVNIADTDAAT